MIVPVPERDRLRLTESEGVSHVIQKRKLRR
jgi:hypothetical protein